MQAEKLGVNISEANSFVYDGLFRTITNANFDRAVFVREIKKGLSLRNKIKKAASAAGAEFIGNLPDCAVWSADSEAEFEIKSATVGVLATENEDVRSLRELLIYGLKGIAAYAEHAANLDYENAEVFQFYV